jgi:hypothetical protein
MGLFVCDICECVENTALGHYWGKDSAYFEDKKLKGKALCSECSPDKFSDGSSNEDGGKWHGKFLKVKWDRVLPMKCDKCDENRRIHFKTPRGKETYEECECGVGNQVYYPEEFRCTEFYIDRSGKGLVGIYNKRQYSDDGYKDSGISTDDLYQSGMDFEKINYYRTMFRVKEDCQKYCDWRTEKEAVSQ